MLKRTKRTPDDPLEMSNLAWLLATRPELKWRNPVRAVAKPNQREGRVKVIG